jgi:hypothetical protein
MTFTAFLPMYMSLVACFSRDVKSRVLCWLAIFRKLHLLQLQISDGMEVGLVGSILDHWKTVSSHDVD